MSEQLHPFVESDANADAETLQTEMAARGYLFFRGAVPAEAVLNVRRQVLELQRDAGWIDDQTYDLMDGVVCAGVQPTMEGKPDYMAVYRKVLKLPDFHHLPADPALMRIAAKLLDCDAPFVHPRRIGRMTFPNYIEATTPPHQDHFYIRGAVETYSCWMPLGDVPIELGGLAVWPGSHQRGFIEHTARFEGAVGGRGVYPDELAKPEEPEWHTGDYQAGDALFFHSFTIHKALPNLTADRMRLSTDNRYQRPQDEIEPGALRPHFDLN
jgi:ectoine hydroxylase-related dioxygenase (phytanoyl-CoA dioxygenase family)